MWLNGIVLSYTNLPWTLGHWINGRTYSMLKCSFTSTDIELRCSCFLFLFRGSNISLFCDLWRKIKYPNLKFFCCNTFHLCSVFFFLYFFFRGCEHAVNNDNCNIYMFTVLQIHVHLLIIITLIMTTNNDNLIFKKSFLFLLHIFL